MPPCNQPTNPPTNQPSTRRQNARTHVLAGDDPVEEREPVLVGDVDVGAAADQLVEAAHPLRVHAPQDGRVAVVVPHRQVVPALLHERLDHVRLAVLDGVVLLWCVCVYGGELGSCAFTPKGQGTQKVASRTHVRTSGEYPQ